MTYTVQFSAGEGRHFNDSVNYLMSTDGSIYAEIQVPENASEDYGYLTMKRAILERIPHADIVWFYDAKNEALLESDADVDAEVYLDIQVEEDDDHADDDDEKEPHLWYAIMNDRDDYDWGRGSYDREEALELARNQLDDYPMTYIAVIDDDHKVLVDTIELDALEDDDDLAEGQLFVVEGNLYNPDMDLWQLFQDGILEMAWDDHDAYFRADLHYYVDRNAGFVRIYMDGHHTLRLGIVPRSIPSDREPDPQLDISRDAMLNLIQRTAYVLQHGVARKIPEDITITDRWAKEAE